MIALGGAIGELPPTFLARATPTSFTSFDDRHAVRHAVRGSIPARNRDHIEKATKLIADTGYHRRDAELAALLSQVNRLSKCPVPG